MSFWKPDQTFYPSPRMAMQGPQEKLGYVAVFNPEPKNGRHDATCVLDLDPTSLTYSQIVGRIEMPGRRRRTASFRLERLQLCLCPYSPHPHMERRYSSFRACAPRASISSTPSPIPQAENRQGDRARGDRRPRRAIGARIRSIAAPKASM